MIPTKVRLVSSGGNGVFYDSLTINGVELLVAELIDPDGSTSQHMKIYDDVTKFSQIMPIVTTTS